MKVMLNIKSIWDNQKPTGEIIIKTKIDKLSHLNCFVATNHITGQHLYIMSVSKNVLIPELKNYRFKGVEIYTIELDDFIEFYIYLLDNDLKEIFSLFVQNILEEISVAVTESEALLITLNVVTKWKKLFDKMHFNGLNIEQQKGLIGELLFLNYLLDNDKTKSNAIYAWTSTEDEFQAKDFTLKSIGIEIKFTSAKHPIVKVTHERQLDSENFSQLFLVLYTCEAVKDNGFSLNSLIDKTYQKIISEDQRILFNSLLYLYGYLEQDKEHYNRMYSIKKIYVFTVEDDFPKITKKQIPLGVYDTSYSIELSAIDKFIVEINETIKNI